MNKQNIILVGRGGFGREVAAWIGVLDLPYTLLGFIDDEKKDGDVIDKIVDHVPRKDAVYLTCFGSGAARRHVRAALEAKGARFASVIDPQIRTASSVQHSINSVLLGTIGISNNVTVGDDLVIHSFASIGHDVKLGNGVTIGSHGFAGGGVVLEECCTIHPNAVVLPRVRIGAHAVVGAGTVAIKNVPAYTTVFGSPAKVIAVAKSSD
jgi:sugar O-acyltransferase (sialic acid O-acetyltransferase NeuD family)